MSNASCNRRQFVTRSLGASAAALGAGRILGANDRISIALIGNGRRNLLGELLQFRSEANAEVRVVCDSWRLRREAAAAAIREATGSEPQLAVHYEEVLARKDIDAVVISTPDHQHCTLLTAAMHAGKDAYVEKPLAMNMKELIVAVDAVKKQNRVVQVGTQMRSAPVAAAARGFVQSGGLGKVFKVEQSRNGYTPYWMSYGGPKFFAQKVVESDVDWKAFLMNQKDRSFNADQYQNWYGFREFSRGPHTNLMVHFIDLMHYVTGAKFPSRVTAMGGTFRWKNQYTCPDSIEVALEYPEGFLVRYNSTFGTSANSYTSFMGTRGTLGGPSVGPDKRWELSGKGSGETDRIQPGTTLPEAESVHHMKNWLDCLRTRKEPIAPIDAGYSHAVAVIMADESFTRGRRVVYDHDKRAIREG